MRISSKLVVLGFLFLIFPNGSSAQSADQREVLQAGDAVRVQIWDLLERSENKGFVSSLANDYVIDANGNILMPFVGLVRVADRTPEEVGKLIKNKYQDFLKQPFIYVRPLIRITIAGSVQKPGAYRIDPQNSLWDLFELAGGPMSDADLRKITVVRGGKVVIDNLLNAFEKGFSLYEVGIQSGDQIRVPRIKNFNIQNVINFLNLGLTIVWLYLRIKGGW